MRFRTLDGAVEAVKGINLHVNAGETVAIVGESGSGKSQTMMAAMSLLASNGEATGVVDYRGRNLLTLGKSELNQIRGRKISMIFQEPMTSLDPLYSIGSQLMEPIRRHRGLGGAEAQKEALRLLDLVQIPDPERRMKSYPHELSGGQRQRVMIAMALANDPDILIADEPTTALDVTIQAQILALLAELQARLGMAIVFITHDLGIVRRFADRVYVMQSRRGRRGRRHRDDLHAPRSIPTRACCSRPSRPDARRRRRPARRSCSRAAMSRSSSASAAASSAGQPIDHARRRPHLGGAAEGADDRHRRRIRIRQVDARAGAAAAAAERGRHPLRRAATYRRPTATQMRRCGANCRSSSRIRSARCRRA